MSNDTGNVSMINPTVLNVFISIRAREYPLHTSTRIDTARTHPIDDSVVLKTQLSPHVAKIHAHRKVVSDPSR